MMFTIFLFLNTAIADTQVWTKAAYRQKVLPKIHVRFTQHLRLEDNATAIESIIPELEVLWKRLPWFDVVTGYRLFWRRTKNDTLELAQRGHVDLEKDWGLRKKLDVGYRLRMQARQELDETEVKYAMRHKIGWAYDAPKGWTPNGFVEYYLTPDARDKFQVGVGSKYGEQEKSFGHSFCVGTFYRHKARQLYCHDGLRVSNAHKEKEIKVMFRYEHTLEHDILCYAVHDRGQI